MLHKLIRLDVGLEQVWWLIDPAPAGEEWTAHAPSLRMQLFCVSSSGAGVQQEDGKEGMA